MFKRWVVMAFAILITTGLVCAQELEISGEIKTGFYWEKHLVDGEETYENAEMKNNDGDSGDNEGRFRLNLHLHKDNNMGMKVRFEQTKWTGTQYTQWAYALGYGDFIDEQLRVSVGKLGESPWGTGGPDIWKEVDSQVGIRFEVKPEAVPGLNAGLVLNTWNTTTHKKDNGDVDNLLVDVLRETVLGVAYTNDYFHGRIGFRLDGEGDTTGFPSDKVDDMQDGMELVYRFEERIIREYLEGFSVWALGYMQGITKDSWDCGADYSIFASKNYLYADYSPEAFSTRLAMGLYFIRGVQTFIGRGSFYYNIFPFLSAGAAVTYRQLFGERAPKDGKPFEVWGLEPQVRVTFNSNAYIAFLYNYGQMYETQGQGDRILKDQHWINLRVVFTF